MLQLIDYCAKTSNWDDKVHSVDVIQKYAWLLEVFCFNTMNLLLVDRVKGANIMMRILIESRKQLSTYEDTTFAEAILTCVASMLRIESSALSFAECDFVPALVTLL